MLLGVLRPLIVLPAGVDDPARLEDILRHEPGSMPGGTISSTNG